jgi:Na+/phosphate symporter
MIIAYIPLVMALIGLVVYLVAVNPKAAELGRILFAAGMLVTMLAMAQHVLRLG